jgi:WD40 repeat protein
LSLSFSHDSKKLASASTHKTIKVWDANGKCLQELYDESMIYSIAFPHDSTKLASASFSGTIMIWDTSRAYQPEFDFYHGYIKFISFSHGSKRRLASVSDHGIAKIWDVGSGECLHIL